MTKSAKPKAKKVVNAMFSSELPMTLELPDGEKPQVINYVNALPGAGKTWVFDNKVALPHVRNEHNSVLVYAAPTAQLLRERERSLLDLGINKNKIMVITSDTLPANLTVAEAFRQVVVGLKGKKGMPNGTVVLCTHECVARIPQSMKGRDRVVLVYDEARACLQDNYALHLSENMFEYLTEPQEHLTEDGRKVTQRLLSKVSVYESTNGDDSESVYIWNWSNRYIPLPTLKGLQDYLPRTTKQKQKAQDILDFLSNVYASSLDVYVSITRKKATNEYVISNVLSPARMFSGYAKVLILSAFFKSSQMYHFLKEGNRLEGPSAVVLQDVTKSYIDRDRVLKLLERMQWTVMTYIFDLGNRTLTKSEMQQGLVVRGQLTPDLIKTINAKWRDIHDQKPEFYRTVYDSFIDREDRASRIEDADRRKAYRFMTALEDRFGIVGGVIPHMVDTSIQLQQTFMKKKGLPYETLPIGINPRYNSYKDGETIWHKEGLDQIDLRDQQYKTPKKGSIIKKLPITAHGLNAYKELHSCAFLASMKYSPREYTLMRRIVPDYDPTIDRTLEYALQLLWRCNVRLPNKNHVLLIVPDRHLATALQRRMQDEVEYWKAEYRVLPIISPQKILKGHTNDTILRFTFDSRESQKRRNENRKNSVKGKEAAGLKSLYMRTVEGKRYYQLSNQISYAKKNGKDFSVLLKERSMLMTFAQWKISTDGIKAYSALNQTKRINTVESLRRLFPVFKTFKHHDNNWLTVIGAIKKYCPEMKEELRTVYPGDSFDHNWDTLKAKVTLGYLFKHYGEGK